MDPVIRGGEVGGREIPHPGNLQTGSKEPCPNGAVCLRPEGSSAPIRISIAKALIHADLPLSPGRHSLYSIGPALAKYKAFELIFGKDARVTAQIQIVDNQIPLALQSLLFFHNVEVDGPLSLNFFPNQISIGEWGGMHIISPATPSANCILNAPMALRPELGHDIPTTKEQWQEVGGLSELVYANFPEDPRIDFEWTQKIPKELLEKNGRLPGSYPLGDLINRLRDLIAKPKTPNPALEEVLKDLLSLDNFKPGEILTFSVLGNVDLNQPGMIAASAEGKTILTPEKNFQIQIPKIFLQGDVLGGTLQNGNTPQLIDGMLVPGGMEIQFAPKEKTLELKANLDLNGEVEFPILGKLSLSGKVLARMKGFVGEKGLQFEPRGSYVQLKDLIVAKPGNPRPLLSEVNLLISDDPQRFASGALKFDFLRNAYLLGAELQGSLQGSPEENLSGTLGVKPEGDSADGTYVILAELKDKAVQFTTPAGKIFLKDLSSRVHFTMGAPTEHGRKFSVNEAYIAVNPEGSPSGLLQGPIRIEQKNQGEKKLTIQWNDAEHRLIVQDLNLALQGKGIQIRSFIDHEKYPFIEPSITSVGFDGSFEGNYTLFLPEDRNNWRGNGILILSGGPDDDMRLYGFNGSRYGPSLFRNTYWQWRDLQRIEWNRRRLMGDFRLYTDSNPRALFPDAESPSLQRVDPNTVYGIHGERLRPYELTSQMNYDNQPWDPQGFVNVVVDYLYNKCLQNEDCSSVMKRKSREGVKP